MTIIQIMYIAIASHLITFSIFYLFYSLFVYRKSGKYLYFSIAALFGTIFLFASFQLFIQSPPETVLFYHKLKIISLLLVVVFWLFCAYDIFFENLKAPFIFMLLALIQIPFFWGNNFITLPIHTLNYNVMGIPYFYQFGSTQIIYKITAVYIFFVFIYSITATFFSRISITKKIYSMMVFMPGIISGINDYAVIYGYLIHPLITEFMIIVFFIYPFILFLRENREEVERISNLKEELESEVEKQTRQLQTAHNQLLDTYREMKQADALKSDMLEIAAHDLKYPLNSVSGYSELLLLKINDDNSSRSMVKKIKKSSNRMIQMIDEMLEMEIHRTGDIQLNNSKFDLVKVVEFVLDRNQKSAKDKEQTILSRTPDSCIFYGDENRIMDILENLVSNAVKYSPFDSSIYVELEHTDSYITIKVKDHGPGLSEEDQKKLFGKYQRLTPRPTGNETSTGLGLYAVKRFVTLHNGMIAVQSSEHKGSTFIVTLPVLTLENSEKQN